jgi:hypothetical protein
MLDAIRFGLVGAPLLLLVVGSCVGQEGDLAPWAANTQPTDARKQHTQEINSGKQEYRIVQGGTMDGTNCRSQMGCGMAREGAIEQTWESNRAVRMENVGETDVVNPWLSNGRNNFRTLAEIASNAVVDGMSDREKAFALWWQQIQYRYHGNGEDNSDLCDPVKVFNTYGHNTCGNDSICLAGLWAQVGLKAAPARAVGHCISQAFYDNAWHFFDGDQHAVYLLRDNETVAGEQDFTRDHDLVRRSHTQGILYPDARWAEEDMAALYLFEGPVTGDRKCKGDTTMKMVLRPGEALTWRWGHLTPAKVQSGAKLVYPDTVCNGLWEYRPDFTKETWRTGADKIEAVKAGPEGLAAEEGKEGSVIWTVRSPYVFVGGRLEVEGQGAKFALSLDGKAWVEVGTNLDKVLGANGPGRYQYQLRCQFPAGAQLKRLAVISDLQMAPLALPAMVVGENRFTYTDESKGERKVRITHGWVERSTSKPPAAPPAPVAPADGGEANGTDVVFQWTPSADPDGDKIADYHFELSNRADMRWPLSMGFAKMISRTADKGKAQYTLLSAGLLTPDTKYYWRVRAKDEKGVWGPWSKTWSFTPRGPSYPLDVAVDFDPGKGVGTLRWKPNPVGRKPAKYRVYGSDEKGFAVGDAPYATNIGTCKELPSSFPANFIAETAATELAVLGASVELPAANKTHYRVVAVDEQGKRSGPSDFASAPRPTIYSKPVTTAKVGAEYRYQVAANRSFGDLRMNPQQVKSFWDIEKPTFVLAEGPKWLKLDAATGLLTGTPDAAGRFEVTVSVSLERPVRKVDEAALKWGNLKVTSTTTETLGPATQKFTIEVGG